MKTELGIISRLLKPALGINRYPFLFRAFFRAHSLFKHSSWYKGKKDERPYARQLALLSAVYLGLYEILGKRAANELMGQIIFEIGFKELEKSVYQNPDPMKQLELFHTSVSENGFTKFNNVETIEKTPKKLHFKIHRCFFSDFFSETGTPELTKYFCEIDGTFAAMKLPRLKFHRNGEENTIAHGKKSCTFVFEKLR